MTPSAPTPRLAARWTPAAQGVLRAIAGRAPWRAEMVGLGLVLLLAGTFITLLVGAMNTAQVRRVDAEAAQRALMACESKPLAHERQACRLALRTPAVAPEGLQQRMAGS